MVPGGVIGADNEKSALPDNYQIIFRWFREGSTEPITNNQHYQISHFAHDDEYVDTILRCAMTIKMMMIMMMMMMIMIIVMMMIMIMIMIMIIKWEKRFPE